MYSNLDHDKPVFWMPKHFISINSNISSNNFTLSSTHFILEFENIFSVLYNASINTFGNEVRFC